jgi:hypothetical protein
MWLKNPGEPGQIKERGALLYDLRDLIRPREE